MNWDLHTYTQKKQDLYTIWGFLHYLDLNIYAKEENFPDDTHL